MSSGKLFSVIGDSISTFRGAIPSENRWFYDCADTNRTGISDAGEMWWQMVIDSLGGALLSNASFSGSMVQGWGFPAGCSMERARQVMGPAGEEPDVILVYMGINDYGWGSPEAQAKAASFATPANYDTEKHAIRKPFDIDAEYDAASISQVDPRLYEDASTVGLAPAGALENFKEAYSQMLYNLKTVAPDARIVCLTLSPGRIAGEDRVFCYRLRGIELDDYNSAIREAAHDIGADVADIRKFGLDYSSIDGTHPDALGMQQISDMVLASLEGCDLPDDYPDKMESIRFPQTGYMAGEEHAPIEENGWKCIA